MFKSPIEWLKEMIQELIADFADMAFGWIEIFMLAPTDFSEYNHIDKLYDFVFTLSVSLSFVFVAWALFGVMMSHLSGTENRSVTEVMVKGVTGAVLAASTPWILDNVLLRLNNAIVQYFLNEGLDTKALEKFAVIPGSAGLAIFLMGFTIVILFVLLAMQYIRRLGEYIVLLTTSPIAAHSVVTENFDIWSVWWREAISVIFSQAYQVAFLWLMLNLLTGTEDLADYMMALGLMVVILAGPKYIRQFLYSSGSGRTVVGAAGGTTKMAVYKFAASKITRR